MADLHSQTQQAPLAAAHPRRPPAHKSVSLLHSPPKKVAAEHVDALSQSSSNVPSSDRANPPSTGSSKPVSKKESSGETSDAGKWFESSNNNVNQDGSYMDNDPPFFLRNSSSSTSPDALHPLQHVQIQGQANMPHRPGLMHMQTDGSSTEDFRSVIDDLTIENKLLKRKLKKYEKVHDAHLQEQKLFEVRVHGLAPSKKRELEDLLKKFAMEADENSSNEETPPTRPSLQAQITRSSHQSLHTADSAYHSMSASGQNSNAASSAWETQPKKKSKSTHDRQQDSIQSYLQDIPLGLMPKAISMTDTAKKRLVVRRLEQIFAGKGAGANGHQQPIQQQEVAQSAAQADRMAIEEETGRPPRKEGLREARIMLDRKRDKQHRALLESDPNRQPLEAAKPGSLPGHQSPDQRPTRPLDLDPQRAQVPAENLTYIRHLGFSPQDPEHSPEDGHGWIYLNLLINMAQLHTINVTTEFVVKALQQYSSQLELSHDGRKVRWRGGNRVSINSSDASPDQEAESSSGQNGKKTTSKRLKFGPDSAHTSSDATGTARSSDPSVQRIKHELSYTPLFYHKDTSSDEQVSNVEPVSDMEQSPPDAEATAAHVSSAFASSGMRTYSSKRKRDDGLITFYNKAKFCTDLSGDRLQVGRSQINYTTFTTSPIGAPTRPVMKRSYGTDDDCRGPLARAALHEMDDSSQPSSSDPGIEIDASPLSSGNSSPSSIEPAALEVSGVGGIIPEDNLFIEVNRRQVRQGSRSVNNGACHALRSNKPYPSKINSALSPTAGRESSMPPPHRKRRLPLYAAQIIAVRQSHLPPSDLPPPSLLPFDSSCDADDSDADSEYSDVIMEEQGSTTEPRLINMASRSEAGEDAEDSLSQVTEKSGRGGNSSPNEDSTDPRLAFASCYRPASRSGLESHSSDDEEDDEDDDGSLDFLATAREIDPESIRAREREYDSNMAERLAEDIPAGSSAATAGGGSGYNSPNHDQKYSPVADKKEAPAKVEADTAVNEDDGDKTPCKEGKTSLKRARVGDGAEKLDEPLEKTGRFE